MLEGNSPSKKGQELVLRALFDHCPKIPRMNYQDTCHSSRAVTFADRNGTARQNSAGDIEGDPLTPRAIGAREHRLQQPLSIRIDAEPGPPPRS